MTVAFKIHTEQNLDRFKMPPLSLREAAHPPPPNSMVYLKRAEDGHYDTIEVHRRH